VAAGTIRGPVSGLAFRLVLSRRLVPLACALAALATAGAAAIASLHSQSWDTTSLVRMHAELGISKLAVQDSPTFRLRQVAGFYDGAFFYAIARDPIATGRAHELLDEAPYYWGHPGYGWLAWLASGGGRPGAVPDALLAVGLICIFAAGWAGSLLARELGWTSWGGLAVALNPGLVYAVSADTSEPLGTALILGGLLAFIRGRLGWTIGLLAALCLVKEPLVLIPLAIGTWELWRRRPPLVALSVIPAVVWWFYLRIHLGSFPFGHGSSRLAKPLVGWYRGLLDAALQSWSESTDTAQLGQAAVPLIIVTGLAILVAAIYALRLRNVVHPSYLALTVLYACITSTGVQYPKDLIRELAPLLTLLPFAFLGGSGETVAEPQGRAGRE
jgi:hypothetical protein